MNEETEGIKFSSKFVTESVKLTPIQLYDIVRCDNVTPFRGKAREGKPTAKSSGPLMLSNSSDSPVPPELSCASAMSAPQIYEVGSHIASDRGVPVVSIALHSLITGLGISSSCCHEDSDKLWQSVGRS